MIGNWIGQNSWAPRAGNLSRRVTAGDGFTSAIKTARELAASLNCVTTNDFRKHAGKLRQFAVSGADVHDTALLTLVAVCL